MGPIDILVEILRAHTSAEHFDDTTPFGADGLGLDSISIAEVLLECEERFGVSFGELLDQRGPLTIGRLLAHLQTSAAAR